MGRLQNNPSIGWVIPKSTHVRPSLAWGNNKENIKQAKKIDCIQYKSTPVTT
jgi:hypothetical protein